MAKQLNYQVNLTVNKNGLNELLASLKQIQQDQLKALNLGTLTSDLNKAGDAAYKLEQVLNKSWNSKIGQLDLSKLNTEIKTTYGSIDKLKTHLESVGMGQYFNKLQSDVLNTNLQLKQSNKLLDEMATSMANTVKWGVTSSIFNNMTSQIQRAWNYSKALDTSLNSIRIVTGKSADEMERYARVANKAAKELGQSTKDYTDASLIYYQQGLGDDKVQARTETTLKAANVTGQTGQEVSEQLTAVWNGYKVQAKETELYVDKLAAVAASTASDLEELSTGMSKVASAANSAGVDFDQLNGILSTVISVTREAPETIGSSFKTIFARLGDLQLNGEDEYGVSLGKVSGQLEELGIQVLDQQGNMRDMGTIIEDTAKKWDTWTNAQKQAAAVAMAGKMQYSRLIALFDNWDMYTDAVNTSAEAMGTLQKQQDIYMDSVEAHLQKLSTEAEKTYDILFDTDSVNEMTDAVSGLLSVFNNFLAGMGGGLQSITGLAAIAGNLFNKQIGAGINQIVQNKQVEIQNERAVTTAMDFSKQEESNTTSEAESNVYKEMREESQKILALKERISTEEMNTLLTLRKEAEQEKLLAAALKEQNDRQTSMVAIENSLKNQSNAIKQQRKEYKMIAEKVTEIEIRRGSQYEEDRTDQLIAQREILSSIDKMQEKNLLTDSEIITLEEIRKKNAKDYVLTHTQIETLQEMSQRVIERQIEEEKELTRQKELQQQLDEGALEIQQIRARQKQQALTDAEENLQRQAAIQDAVKGLTTLITLGTSVKGIWQTINKEELSGWDKFSQISSTLLFTLPMLIFNFKAIKGLLPSLAKSLGATSLAENATGREALGASIKVMGLNLTLGQLLLIVGAVVAALVLLGIGINAAIKEQEKYNQAVTDANKRASELTETYKEMKSAYEDLKSSIEEYEEMKKALNVLTKGTEEWYEKVTEVNDKVIELMKNYPSLMNYIHQTPEGVLEIDEEGYKAVLKEQQKQVRSKQVAAQFAQQDIYRAQVDADVDNFRRNNKFMAQGNQPIGREKIINGDYVDKYASREDLNNGLKEIINLIKSDRAGYLRGDLDEQILNIGKNLGVTDLAKSLDTNRKDLLTFADSLSRYQTSIDTYSNTIISLIGQDNVAYQQSEHKETINKNLENNVDKAHKEARDKVMSIKDNEELAQYWINNLAPDDVQTVNYKKHRVNLFGGAISNTDSTLTYNQNGEEKKVDLETLRELIISSMAEKNINSNITSNSSLTDYAYNMLSQDSSKSLSDVIDLLATGKDVTTIYTKEELEAFNTMWKEYLSTAIQDQKDLINEYISNIDNLNNQFNNSIANGKTKEEITQIARDDLKSKSTSLNKDSTTLYNGIQSGDITSENIKQSEEYKNILEQLEKIKRAYPEVAASAEILSKEWLVGTQEYLEALSNVQDALYANQMESLTETANNKIDDILEAIDLDEDVYGPHRIVMEIDTDDGNFQNKMEEILNAEYQIDVAIHTEAEQEFNDINNAINNINEQASKIGEKFIVAANDVRELNNTFPGIIQGMRDLGDGTVQLNQEVVESAIGMAQAEIAADSEATIKKLQNQANLLREKQTIYQNMANAASILAQTEVDIDGAGADQKAIISENLEKLKGINDQLGTQNEIDNDKLAADASKDNGKVVAKNWIQAYQSAAKSSYKFAQTAIANMKAAADPNGVAVAPGDFGVNYRGSSGVSSEAKVLKGIQNALDSSKLDNKAWADLAQKYQMLADSAGKAANDIDSMIAQIGASNVENLNKLNNIKSGKGANPKKDSGSNNKPDQMDLLDKEKDRYHDIDIILKQISTDLNRLEKQKSKLFGKDLIVNLNKQLQTLDKQIDATRTKINIAEGEAAELRGQLSQYGAQFNQDGTLSNYSQIYTAQLNYVNSLIAQYNSMSKEQQEAFKDTVETAKKNFDKFTDSINNYDKLISETIPGLKDQIQEAIDKEIEIKITEFTMEIKIRLDMSEAERDWNEFKRKVIDGIKDDDILGNAKAKLANFNSYYNSDNTGEVQSLMKQVENTQRELEQMDKTGWSDFYGDNRAQALEDLKSYNDKLMKSMEDVEDLVEEIKKSYLSMIDEANDKFKDQVSMYEQVKDIIDHDMNIIKLVYGEDSYKELAKYYQMQEDNNNKQLDFQRQQKDFWYNQMQILEKGSDEWEKAKENWMSAVSEWNKKVEEAVQNIKDKYLNAINEIFDKLNDKVTNGAGLDYVAEEWELINKNADQYLDTINSLYGIQSLENKYLDAIDKTDSLSAQRKLNALMEEELDALREKDKLTQYDIDRANMKYEIALKQIALEEAQQNKSTMRLRRDSQGNYTYQYVADNDQVGQLQDELSQLKNELYNFDLARYKDNLDQVLSIYQEFQEKMKEAAQINDPEKRAQMELLLQEQYGELINGLVEQNETIRLNLHDSAFTELADLYKTDLSNFQSLSDDEKDVLLNQMIPQWDSGVQHMSDKFAGEGGFIPTCKDAMEELDKATQDYEQDLDELQAAAGQDFNAIQQGIDDTKTKTEELIQDNQTLISTYQEQLQAVQAVINELQNLCQQYNAVKTAAQEAAEAAYNYWRAVNNQAANDASNNVSNGGNTSGNSNGNSNNKNGGSNSGGSGSGSGDGGGATVGNKITYSGSYYYDSFGTSPSGSKYAGVSDGVTIDIVNNNPYGIHIKSSDGKYPDLGWIKRSQVTRWNTGGYTGDWGDDSGRLAILDRKELVLDKDDTSNMLNILEITRGIMNSMNSSILSRIANSIGGVQSSSISSSDNPDVLEQKVHIDASFPNVRDSREIEEALNNLVNVASQKIGHNNRR